MCINFQTGESFDLRNDPARFLAAGDFIGERDAAAILGAQANGVRHLSLRATLLSAGDRNNRVDVRDGETLRRPDTKDPFAGSDFAVADADARGPEGDVEQGIDQEQVRKSEHNGENSGSFGKEQEISRSAPDRSESQKKERARGTAKSRKVKFRARRLAKR